MLKPPDRTGENASPAVVVREATAGELEAWDRLVRGFHGHRVVHTRDWLESLEASLEGRAVYLVGRRDADVVGCWPGLLMRRGPFRMFGSPPPGSQTASMGPLFAGDRIAGRDFVAQSIRYLEKELGVHHVELISSLLDEADMRGMGFRGEALKTHKLSLMPGDAQQVFRGFKQNARRNVRRAEKLRLQVRLEDDPDFADEAYDQIRDVCQRRREAVSYSKKRLVEFLRHMGRGGYLLALSVRLPDGGPTIASGLFTIEGKELLLWQWAHRSDYRWYRPTEFMTWHAMQRAMQAGCLTCDLMGGGGFKKGFGAVEDFSQHRWMRSRYQWLELGRRLAEACVRWQQSWRGRLHWQLLAKRDKTTCDDERDG
jgi:hypothetical protein